MYTVYTLTNKYQAGFKYVKATLLPTLATVAVIIRVVYICAFMAFLCLSFITVIHAGYILTKDTTAFA
jgi:hypothetical protein